MHPRGAGLNMSDFTYPMNPFGDITWVLVSRNRGVGEKNSAKLVTVREVEHSTATWEESGEEATHGERLTEVTEATTKLSQSVFKRV